MRRLLVVSHPCVLPVNQEVYGQLQTRGSWDITLVVPSRWSHEYSEGSFAPQPLPGLTGRLVALPVLLAGSPQRHVYRARVSRQVDRARPDVVFLEQEPFALVCAQWAQALVRRGIPFGVQAAENIDRRLPLPVRAFRDATLRRAAFVAARSESAAALVRQWGARGDVALAPHAVPPWPVVPASAGRPFTVGYAGRLVPEKGLTDLLAAVRRLDAPTELVLIGDGVLRSELEGAEIPGSRVRVVDDLTHDMMAEGYAQMDVLALPSRTTPRWKEQFGRVVVEALWCGVPVVGSDSGEIPWLIATTGGGTVYPEGDVPELAAQLDRLKQDPALRRRCSETGRASVERLFSLRAATDALERLLESAAPGGATTGARAARRSA